MLSQSDVSLTETLERFSRHEVSVSFLVPTNTGYQKSIMDATEPVREYLKDNGIHDYIVQLQGQEHSHKVKSYFVHHDHLTETRASLYRPVTKNGDPRIWFSGLKKYCKPGNLLALLAHKEAIYVVNCSDPLILGAIDQPHLPLGRLVSENARISDVSYSELLNLLHPIADLGFVRSRRKGSTGVGKTLESLLGIADNSSKLPDFKGIEIKGTRASKVSSGSKVNLYSQVPDWGISACKSDIDLLRKHGYLDAVGVLRLSCTLRAEAANPQGLFLAMDEELQWLDALCSSEAGPSNVVKWAVSRLKERLIQKHQQTFWVRAERKVIDKWEYFRYFELYHTKNPRAEFLPYLLQDGTVTVDFTLKLKPNGTADQHGYLFKIKFRNLASLFPPPTVLRLGAA